VDEILNAKPIDRRQIIEESAGVLKYKKRKAESSMISFKRARSLFK
jgi:chromosome segregation protein